MNFLKILLNRASVSMVPTSKRHGSHVKKTWFPRQKDMVPTSKRIVFNIKLSFQEQQQAANKELQSLKAALQNAQKKHLYLVYKKRKRKSSVFLQNFGKIIFKLCRKERKK